MQEIISNDEVGALVRVVLSADLHHVSEGKSFKAKTRDPALASAGTKIIAFKTPNSDENIHLVVIPDSSLLATTELLEGPTVTVDTGTPTQWKNRNRKSPNLSGMLSIETAPQVGYFNLDATITADGEVLDTIDTNADKKQLNQNRDFLEWELAPDTVYAVRLTSGATANVVSLELIAYETEEY